MKILVKLIYSIRCGQVFFNLYLYRQKEIQKYFVFHEPVNIVCNFHHLRTFHSKVQSTQKYNKLFHVRYKRLFFHDVKKKKSYPFREFGCVQRYTRHVSQRNHCRKHIFAFKGFLTVCFLVPPPPSPYPP